MGRGDERETRSSKIRWDGAKTGSCKRAKLRHVAAEYWDKRPEWREGRKTPCQDEICTNMSMNCERGSTWVGGGHQSVLWSKECVVGEWLSYLLPIWPWIAASFCRISPNPVAFKNTRELIYLYRAAFLVLPFLSLFVITCDFGTNQNAHCWCNRYFKPYFFFLLQFYECVYFRREKVSGYALPCINSNEIPSAKQHPPPLRTWVAL